MELLTGRPADCERRSEKEIGAYDLLDSLGIAYERVDHEPAMTMELCAEIDRVLDATICKNLFLTNRQCTNFYLLMMPGDKPFKTKDISAQLGTSRLSFGSPEKMEELLHTSPGSASVLGLMHDKENAVRLVVDREVLGGEYIGCHPLVNTSSLRLKTVDVIEKILPAVAHTPTVVDLPRYEETN